MTVSDNDSTIIPHGVAVRAVISSHQHLFFFWSFRLPSIFSTLAEKHSCNLFMAIKTVEMRIIRARAIYEIGNMMPFRHFFSSVSQIHLFVFCFG